MSFDNVVLFGSLSCWYFLNGPVESYFPLSGRLSGVLNVFSHLNHSSHVIVAIAILPATSAIPVFETDAPERIRMGADCNFTWVRGCIAARTCQRTVGARNVRRPGGRSASTPVALRRTH